MVVLAVALSGCAFFPGIQEKLAGEDSAPPTSPSSAEQTGQALFTKPFDLFRSSWADYRLTVYTGGQPATSTVRLEYDLSSASGIKTQSIKRTITSGEPSVNIGGNGQLYSLRVYNSRNSMTSSATMPFEYLKKDDPVLCADDITESSSGSESVTVPKGTFDCKKYLGNFKGADATYWGAPGVPVPVKVYTACDGATLELVDWG